MRYSTKRFFPSHLTLALMTILLGCSRTGNTYYAASTISDVVSSARAANLAANAPELPRVYLNTTYVPPTGKTINVAAGDNLQAAIDQANPGDVISLQAGATFTGNFRLKSKPAATQGSPWIIIRSSTPDANFPSAGTRVGPNNASLMAKIVTANSLPAVVAEKGAHHYRLTGLELGIATGNTLVYEVIELDAEAKSLQELPRDIIIDRCFIHGNNTGVARRGVLINSASTAVIDSYIANFHDVADAQAILSTNGSGPFKIVNNYLEATGENFMLGGADPAITNLVPSDIEFRRNQCSKPLRWKEGHPTYDGQDWTIKNNFELKNARRILVEHNLFEYNWTDGQDGMAIVITPRNQNGNSPWSVVEDLIFRNNIIQHAGGGIDISGRDTEAGTSETSRRVLIKNNLLLDIDGKTWGSPGEEAQGEFMQVGGGVEHVTIDHNTAFQSGNILSTDGADKPNIGLIFTNNITPHNTYGVIGSNSEPGLDTLNRFFPQFKFQSNIIINTSTDYDSKLYPTANFFISTFDKVGFVNMAAQNYRLSPSSPYKSAGTDGQDIGCNIDVLMASALATSVNAANYRENAVAPELITSIFGTNLSNTVIASNTVPLPTSLAGSTVAVRDSAGVERLAQLFFVSPTQTNFLIPAESAIGSAIVTITNSTNAKIISETQINRVAPGIFTADASGKGIPTGFALRLRNNSQSYESITNFDQAQNKWVPIPIDLGPPTDQVYLVLFGTGWRNRSGLNAVSATIGGINGSVIYAGKQGTFIGLDQVNVLLQRDLIGRGTTDLVLTVDGQQSNTVQVNTK
jgi:uncharacterized protein (TIGR03437 family)